MDFMVESIGTVFRDKDLPSLAGRFSSRAAEGYHLHSVFQVTQPGCLGIGTPSVTYLAVYKRTGDS